MGAPDVVLGENEETYVRLADAHSASLRCNRAFIHNRDESGERSSLTLGLKCIICAKKHVFHDKNLNSSLKDVIM